MTKTKLLLLAGFVLALVAGFVAGHASAPLPHPPGHGPGHGDDGWLTKQLNLTPDQQKQMHEIWSRLSSPEGHGGGSEQRHQVEQERDQAIHSLLQGDQAAAYDKIMQDYHAKLDALAQANRKRFEQARDETMKILTPEQRQLYEQLLHRRMEGRSGHPSSNPATEPTTRPAIE